MTTPRRGGRGRSPYPPGMNPASINLAGAVPLDALASRSTATAAPPAAGAGSGAPRTGGAAPAGGGEPILDVTEASFATDVLDRSMTVPVVIDLWAEWCAPCRQLSPVLEKLAREGAGSWVLAKIDVDANPRIAQALQVQGIPAVKAVFQGQLVAEFTGAVPEAQLRQWITSLLDAVGAASGAPAGGEPGSAIDPEILEAEDLLAENRVDEAEAKYRSVLDRAPADPEARSGLARVALVRRAQQLDPGEVQARLRAQPDDPQAVLDLADVLLLSGRVDEAFDRLLALVRAGGAAREAGRARLVELFDALAGHPAVEPARRKLGAALF